MASGSGPLSSLLFFSVLLVLLTLNLVGNKAAMRCSNSSLLSQTNAPVVPFQTENERAPNTKIESNLPSLLLSPKNLETFKRPNAVFAFKAATPEPLPPIFVVSTT